MKEEDKKFEKIKVPFTSFAPPAYLCEKHGAFSNVLMIKIKNEERYFCLDCWYDFLKRNIGEVHEIKREEENDENI